MATPKSDFVMVQLTAHAQQLAGEHPLITAGGRRSFTFTGDTPIEVERSYEWTALLSKRVAADGTPLFQLAPVAAEKTAAAATKISTTAPAATPAAATKSTATSSDEPAPTAPAAK